MMIRRLGCLLGLGLVAIGVLTMVTFFSLTALPVIGQDTIDLLEIPQTLFCEKGESILQDVYSVSSPNEITGNVSYACVDEAGRERDITDEVIGISIAGFVVCITLGLIIGISSMATTATPSALPFGKDLTMKVQKGNFVALQSNDTTLADKLSELQKAYEQRLINRVEYDKLRSLVMKNFAEQP